MMLITTFVVSLCKDGGGSVNVKLWFLVVCVLCEVVCCLVVAGNVFLLIIIVVILYPGNACYHSVSAPFVFQVDIQKYKHQDIEL